MKKIPLLILCLITILMAMTSCKKEGATGPAGSANVIYSDWFTPNPWVKDTVFNIFGFNYTKPAPQITRKVLDSSVVLTYAKLTGYNSQIWPAGQVGQLPITITYRYSAAGISYTDTWSSLSTVGNLHIRFVNDQNYYSSIAASHQFRYIIIPGGKATGRSVQLSYHDICTLYNIPE